jgi:hypothetical protein
MEVVAMLHGGMLHGGMLHGGMLKASGKPAVNRDHEESKQALKQHLEVEHQVGHAVCTVEYGGSSGGGSGGKRSPSSRVGSTPSYLHLLLLLQYVREKVNP